MLLFIKFLIKIILELFELPYLRFSMCFFGMKLDRSWNYFDFGYQNLNWLKSESLQSNFSPKKNLSNFYYVAVSLEISHTLIHKTIQKLAIYKKGRKLKERMKSTSSSSTSSLSVEMEESCFWWKRPDITNDEACMAALFLNTLWVYI